MDSVRINRWGGIALLVLALILYAFTLDNGLRPEELRGGDLITHQYAQVQARPSNAPGYPLYTMGGWLWFHSIRTVVKWLGNPLPNPIPILSSYSTLWALIALWLFYKVLLHITRSPSRPHGNWSIAWLISAFYAVTYFFWYYATTTEQYSSAVAQTLAIVYVYLLWKERLKTGRQEEGKKGRQGDMVFPSSYLLFFLSVLCGLSLAHMLTVAFIVPPLVAVILWDAPWLLRRPKIVISAVIAALLPLISYSYVYLRGAANPEWWGRGSYKSAADWFWSFVRTSQGWEELGWGLEEGRSFFGGGFPELIWQELSIPLLLIGLIGIAFLGRKLAVLIYATLAIYLAFCWGYRYGNWFQVILPAYPLLLMGAAKLIDNVQRSIVNGQWPMGRWKSTVLPLLLVLSIIWRVNASLPAADSRNRADDTALDRAAILLDQPLPQDAALFAAVDDRLALQYLIDIWGIRTDLQVVSSQQADNHLAAGGVLLSTTETVPTLLVEAPQSQEVPISLAGPDWVRSGAAEEFMRPELGEPQEPVPGVVMAGYKVDVGPDGDPVLQATPTVDLTLFWQLQNGWPDELSISVRPMLDGAFMPDNSGGILQRDVGQPAHGLFALENFASDGLVPDAYRLPANADALMVILYRPTADGFENVAEIELPLDGINQ